MDARLQARGAFEPTCAAHSRRRVRGPLSAAHRFAERRMIALEALFAGITRQRGPLPPLRVHSAGGGNGPDRADRRLGAAHRPAPRRRAGRDRVRSRSTCRRAIPKPRAGHDRAQRAGGPRLCRRTSSNSKSPKRPCCRRRGDPRHPAPAERARGPHLDRRFRHRLFVAGYLRSSRSTRSRSTAPSSGASSATGKPRDHPRDPRPPPPASA